MAVPAIYGLSCASWREHNDQIGRSKPGDDQTGDRGPRGSALFSRSAPCPADARGSANRKSNYAFLDLSRPHHPHRTRMCTTCAACTWKSLGRKSSINCEVFLVSPAEFGEKLFSEPGGRAAVTNRGRQRPNGALYQFGFVSGSDTRHDGIFLYRWTRYAWYIR